MECGPFGSDRALRAVFADPRLQPWRDSAPGGRSVEARVDATIDYLRGKYDEAGRNALILFLQVLSERAADQCGPRLAELAEQVAWTSAWEVASVRDPSPQELFERAMHLYVQGELIEAQALFEEVKARKPLHPRINEMLYRVSEEIARGYLDPSGRVDPQMLKPGRSQAHPPRSPLNRSWVRALLVLAVITTLGGYLLVQGMIFGSPAMGTPSAIIIRPTPTPTVTPFLTPTRAAATTPAPTATATTSPISPPLPGCESFTAHANPRRALPESELDGEILIPTDCTVGIAGGAPIVVSGTVEEPPGSHHLWLLVYAPNGRYYPQCDNPLVGGCAVTSGDGTWSVVAFVGRPECREHSHLVLVEVDAAANRTLAERMYQWAEAQQYAEAVSFEGLTAGELNELGVTELDAIEIETAGEICP